MSSRWQDIYRHLSKGGIRVYSPGQHQGECLNPYVVVKDAGSLQFNEFSSTQNLYDLMCYVPKDRFSELEPFVDHVESLMEGLYPMLRPTHDRTPSFYDDSFKAHMISIQYINYRKFKR